MTVELNRKQTWALGTEATLDTKGENVVFEVDMDTFPKVIEFRDDDTEDTLEEKGANGGVPISNPNDTVKAKTSSLRKAQKIL